MRVLHIISSSGLYGAEAVILTLMQEMQRNGQPHVLGVFDHATGKKIALHEAALSRGLESHLLPCKGQLDLSTSDAIRTLAASTGADIVHAHGYKADIYVLAAMRKSSVPLVATCHLWTGGSTAVKVYDALDRLCLRRYKAIAAVSEAIRTQAVESGMDAAKVTLIQNGIDWKPFAECRAIERQNPDNHPLTVGFAARLATEKGTDLLMQAISLVVKELPSTQFKVAGDGPERAAIEHSIREQNLSGNVTLLGRHEDMPGFFASIDVLFSSSRAEGLPMALLEGMASGAPIVATAVGDVPAIVRNEVTGLLVPSGDVQAMAAALIRLLKDSALRKKLGDAAQTFVKTEFSAERMTQAYRMFYERALAK